MNCQDHLYRALGPATGQPARWFLEQCGVGLGSIALGQLLQAEGYAQAPVSSAQAPASSAGASFLAPKQPHHPPTAKRVLFLFMAGALQSSRASSTTSLSF